MIINYDNIIIESNPENIRVLLLILRGLDYPYYNDKRRDLIETIERNLEEGNNGKYNF